MIFRQFFQVCCLQCIKGQVRCPNDYDSPQGRFKGQIDDFPRLTCLLSVRAPLHCPPCLYFICRASRRPITGAEFKFVARQVVAKLEFVAESKTRVYFAQHVASNCNTILLRDKLVTNVVIRATEGFNLHCNNVARQVEEQFCPYYCTFNVILRGTLHLV